MTLKRQIMYASNYATSGKKRSSKPEKRRDKPI